MRLFTAVILTLLCPTLSAAPRFSVEEPPMLDGISLTHAAKLCALSKEVQQYRQGGVAFDKRANHIGPLEKLGFQANAIQHTLQRICQIQQQDLTNKQPSRLSDANFLANNFQWIRWKPDTIAAAKLAASKSLVAKLPSDKILLTKYYIRQINASVQQSASHPHALYKLPFDEQHLTIQQAEKQKDSLTRYQYGKQDILTGKISDKAPPLAWVSRDDLEAGLMQGTAVSDDGKSVRYFNVHRNNGIAYNRALNPKIQQRYWYFREVDGIYGYGKDAGDKVKAQPQMTLAGDVNFFGLGQLFMLSYPLNNSIKRHYRLAIMGDTGGAFVNNQFQIDLLTGYYRNWDEYHSENKHLADYVDAWILVAK